MHPLQTRRSLAVGCCCPMGILAKRHCHATQMQTKPREIFQCDQRNAPAWRSPLPPSSQPRLFPTGSTSPALSEEVPAPLGKAPLAQSLLSCPDEDADLIYNRNRCKSFGSLRSLETIAPGPSLCSPLGVGFGEPGEGRERLEDKERVSGRRHSTCRGWTRASPATRGGGCCKKGDSSSCSPPVPRLGSSCLPFPRRRDFASSGSSLRTCPASPRPAANFPIDFSGRWSRREPSAK